MEKPKIKIWKITKILTLTITIAFEILSFASFSQGAKSFHTEAIKVAIDRAVAKADIASGCNSQMQASFNAASTSVKVYSKDALETAIIITVNAAILTRNVEKAINKACLNEKLLDEATSKAEVNKNMLIMIYDVRRKTNNAAIGFKKSASVEIAEGVRNTVVGLAELIDEEKIDKLSETSKSAVKKAEAALKIAKCAEAVYAANTSGNLEAINSAYKEFEEAIETEKTALNKDFREYSIIDAIKNVLAVRIGNIKKALKIRPKVNEEAFKYINAVDESLIDMMTIIEKINDEDKEKITRYNNSVTTDIAGIKNTLNSAIEATENAFKATDWYADSVTLVGTSNVNDRYAIRVARRVAELWGESLETTKSVEKELYLWLQ